MQALESFPRRSLLACALAIPLASLLERSQGPSKSPPEEPRIVDPPGPLPAGLKPKLERALAELEGGKRTTSEILREPASNELRPYTEFRELIRDHAKQAKTCLVPSDEPGDPLVVRLHVVDESGKPREGVLVYAYQTSAKGWYSAEAPHVGGNSGDTKHARLFGYARTDADGWVELSTIRPGGYPRSDLPQHIHVHLEGGPDEREVSEVLFADDPRLTKEVRETALREGAVVVEVKRADGVQRCEAEFRLRRSAKR
jgi:protocatechuate 3,4-dioxygenase beta subunit